MNEFVLVVIDQSLVHHQCHAAAAAFLIIRCMKSNTERTDTARFDVQCFVEQFFVRQSQIGFALQIQQLPQFFGIDDGIECG